MLGRWILIRKRGVTSLVSIADMVPILSKRYECKAREQSHRSEVLKVNSMAVLVRRVVLYERHFALLGLENPAGTSRGR